MRVLASQGCVAATATMARESGKFLGSVMEGGWPEVGWNELAVVGGERAIGEEATCAVTHGECASVWRRWQIMEAHSTAVGVELWWVGWPRGHKSCGGGGGWSDKSLEGRSRW